MILSDVLTVLSLPCALSCPYKNTLFLQKSLALLRPAAERAVEAMLESSNWRLEGGSEASIVDTDSRVAKSIASYKASLGKEMTSLKRSERKMKCYEESLASYRKDSFEEALELFAEYLALVESESFVDPEMRATLYSNIAVCLHQLGEWDLAKLYYDTALTIFETATTSTAAW